MEILNERAHLDLEPFLEHLEGPIPWPERLVRCPSLEHGLEQIGPDPFQDLVLRRRIFVFRQEVDRRL
jgi:hypothetical protein